MQWVCSSAPPHGGPPENAGVREPLLILSPLLGIPENAGVTEQFHPLAGLREGKDAVATSEFAPFVGDSRECRGCVAVPPHGGPPENAGVRGQLLILFPLLGGLPRMQWVRSCAPPWWAS